MKAWARVTLGRPQVLMPLAEASSEVQKSEVPEFDESDIPSEPLAAVS